MSKSPDVTKQGRTARVELDGGALLLVEPSDVLPLVSLTVALRSGSTGDPPGKDGLSRLVTRLLRRGTEGMDATATEIAIDSLGAELSVEVSASSIALHAQVIARNLVPLIDLVANLLARPAFSTEEFDKLKRETVAEIVEARDSDSTLARRALQRAVFAHHPYGRRAAGLTRTVGDASSSDVRPFYAKHFVRGNAVILFSGDIDTSVAEQLAKRLALALPAGARVDDDVPEPEKSPGRRLVIVDKPERTQTQLLVGSLGTHPSDDDHFALLVANAVFGGTFTSRLMNEIRSKRGWSYGAGSRLDIERRRHAFAMSAAPAATDSAPCLSLMVELFERFVDKGISPKEAGFIKKYLERSFAFEVDTAQKRAQLALDVELLGMPEDYYSNYVGRIRAVTTEAANAAVKNRLDPSSLCAVVVGTAAEIGEGVTAAVPNFTESIVVPYDLE